MKIIQLSDIHFGAEDIEALKHTEALVDRMCPDALIVCGDLTQRGKRSEFKAARTWIDQFQLPTLIVPGNHDTPLLNLAKRVTAPFDRFEQTFGDKSGPLEIGCWRFAGLNTARGWQARSNWAEGVVDLAQLAEAASLSRHTAIVCHHPFVSPPGSPLVSRTKRGAAADDLLKRAPATLSLSGHVHTPSAAHRTSAGGGYVAITAGTLSTRLRQSPPSCNVLWLEDSTIASDAVFLEDGLRRKTLGSFDI